MSDLPILTIQILFTLLFLWAVRVAVRDRDLLARDVALVFAPITLILTMNVLIDVFGRFPTWVDFASTIFLLTQPVFSLKLVSDVRGLPRWLLRVAIAATVLSSVLVVLSGGAVILVLGGIAVFIVTELVAAGYLATEARRRSGAARVRLAVAALATALVAGSLLAVAASAAGPGATAPAAILLRGVTLLAAVGYAIAFLPPRFLRRFWQGTAAFEHSERLLAASPATATSALWDELATTATQLTGAASVVLVQDDDGLHVVGSSLDSVATGTTYAGDLGGAGATDPADPGSPAIRSLIAASGHRFAKVVPLAPEQVQIGAIVLLRDRPSLFDTDDASLVEALGVRSAQLVQRREVLADQEALSTRLAQTVAALEAASAAKSDFLASMSHELRTPLNAIIGFSALMAGQREVDGMLSVPEEWVQHIRSGGEHLLTLINDVLDLAKVEAGRMDLAIESIDLGHAIRESAGGLRPLADRKGQPLEVSIDGSVSVDVDPARLRQILYNLLSNAIKYSPDGAAICVTGSRSDGEVRIAVQDHGVGIAADDHARVFEEFRQVGDQAQRLSGTGLGLALTRRLVEAHGGRIELQSALGFGSTFTVILPDRSAIEPPADRGAKRPAAALEVGGRDILVIEDEASSARLLQTYLTNAGYTVRIATDGEQGLALVRARRPAAIVLDILLPGIDGWEVLRRLKSDQTLRDVPVIIATVVDERGVGLALGAVDYLVKPIDPGALLERLRRYTFTTKVKTRSMTVLAIDDDPAALDIVESTLTPLGFAVRRASSGEDGIALAESCAADLVICDLMMPGVDGFEVISRLRGAEATSAVPILVLTAQDLSALDKARLNGRVLGIAAKGESGVNGLSEWLRRVLPPIAVHVDPAAVATRF
jgi:signal transduction histidine kinase/DNA-binding response OmpR family regulator